jgi:putative Flp pilus-assembly TadE/G-like protein
VLWLVVTLPIFVFLFVGVVMIGNIWLARVELENALEAAALAAVKEWGDANGGDTLIPRNVGVAYAAANTMSGVPVEITTNYDFDGVTGNVNQNLLCYPTKPNPITGLPPGGNLVFGAITIENKCTPDEYVIFDAGTRPSCGPGRVLFDVSGQGKAGLDADNAWGVAFRRTDYTPDNLRINSIQYDLRASGGTGVFVSAPERSSNDPRQWRVRDGSGGNSQPDIEGFSDPDDQIAFVFDPLKPWLLTINFSPDPNPLSPGDYLDDGFDPCDRFRFGIRVDEVATGSGKTKNDGDGIGEDKVGVTVTFEQGPVDPSNPPIIGSFSTVFINRTNTLCRDEALTDPFCHNPPFRQSLIVNDDPGPSNQTPDQEAASTIPDLPCSPANAKDNSGQSWTVLAGAGVKHFGVRAQAIAPVVNPFCGFCGLTLKPHFVTVRTTAIYDCVERRPRLIRIDEYICPGPRVEP